MKVLKDKEKGVSEVLGSILVLLITVTLFSSVFYYVSTLPTPKTGTYSEFDAKLQLVNTTSGTYANITVKNVGGESLPDDKTMFIVVIDAVIARHTLSEFGNQSFATDNQFSQGEEFVYNSSWDGHTATNTSTIAIMLYDIANSRVIWSETLHGRMNLPGIVVGIMSSPMPIVLGKYASIKAIVFDPDPGDDVSTYQVGVDLSSLNESHYVKMKYAGNNLFVTSQILFHDTSLDVRKNYKVTVYVKDNMGRNVSYSGYLYVTRGNAVRGADVFIDPSMVSLSDGSPTHMSDVTVTVTVQNRGGTGATFKLEVIDEYSGYPGGQIYIDTNLGDPMPSNGTYTVAAAGQTTISFLWKRVGSNETGVSMGRVSGVHHLIIKAIDVQGVDGSAEENHFPNTADVAITVLPKLLFVDADQAIEGTPNDVSKYYQYMLDTCDYSYTTKRIMGDTLLTYDGTLRNYDLVIWETGYFGDSENVSAVSPQQMSELYTYYSNGGALWLISPELSTDAFSGNFGLTLSKLQIPSNTVILGDENPDINLTLPNGHVITDSLINDRSTARNVADAMGIPSGGNPLINDTIGPHVLAVYMENAYHGKFVYFGFEFSRIMHYYSQNFIGYRILLWLGNITARVGTDVAVDDLQLSTEHPLYMQNVTVTAIISNNGEAPISTSVLLKIDGVKSPDIISANPNNTGVIPGNGGFVRVNFTWVPRSPGMHELEVYVDPYNLIKETNEENNFLDTSILNNKIYVAFSTLIIYNNSNPNVNSTDSNLTTLQTTFDDLGYAYQELNVYDRTNLPAGYPDGTYFTRYNLVIWVETDPCTAGTTDNYIGYQDAHAIYLAIQHAPVGFMFLGAKMPEVMSYAIYDTNSDNDTLLSLYGVQIKSSLSAGNHVLFGYNYINSPTDGLAFIVSSSTSNADLDLLTGTNNLTIALFRGSNDYNTNTDLKTLEEAYVEHNTPSLTGYGIATVSTLYTKGMILPFDISSVKGIFGLRYTFKPAHPAEQARDQLMFHMLRWFGQLELSPELAVYEPEIQIQSEIPQIMVGHSYLLRAVIHNFGDVGASTIVRFYDDYEWIGSKSVYVPADNQTTVEIVWTPMFASQARHIRVVVDPLNEVKEIYNASIGEVLNFNNEAIMSKTVWYFWDNMEHGTENWEHEATLANINGETPLDFLARKDVDTNVIGDWDWDLTGVTDNSYQVTTGSSVLDHGIYMTNDPAVENFTHNSAHTQPSAYWLPEVPKVSTRKPIDAIFVIDTSGSMNTAVPDATVGDVNGDGTANTRIDVAIAAAINAISILESTDRVAVFVFNQNGNGHPELYIPFTYTTTANKNTIDNDLKSLRATGGTPLYDTTSWAVYYMDENGRTDATKGILVMTDGLSNEDNYGTSNGAQYCYAPGIGDYEEEQGVIKEYVKGQSSGLLKIPYDLLTISIAPNGWDGRLFAVGNSSAGNISMALMESNATVIEQVFRMFISLLVAETTGGVRAAPPIPLYSSPLGTHKNTEVSPFTVRATTITNLGAAVFSDGFRAYAAPGGTGTPDDAPTPGFTGTWIQRGFTITSTGNGAYYYKSQSAGWTTKYWVAQTSTDGAYLEHTVYPNDVLKYHYPGSYSIDNAEIMFWAGLNGYDNYWPDATINVYANGVLIKTFNNVLDGSYQPVTGNKYEGYYVISLPSSIYTLSSYPIEIKVVSTKDKLAIDDVVVIYHIDYTPPPPSTGGTIPTGYASTINLNVKYRYMVTPPVSISANTKSAMLSFWTKYWMTEGTNGGVIYIWGKKPSDTNWVWDASHRIYIKPLQPYTGNLLFSGVNTDSTTGGPDGKTGLIDMFGNDPYWCFNGRSEGGTFDWEYIKADLTPYLSYFSEIRIVFLFAQFGGLSASGGWHPEMGWYVDDVKIKVTEDGTYDLWKLTNLTTTADPVGAHSGNYAWVYSDSNGNLPEGIDSSLITKQIDLTSARNVSLDFWIRFNLNPAAGLPPATVRVEVSSNNGITWNPITYGVRIGWGSSGHGGYAGTLDSGATNAYGWVNSHTLLRINCDLSGWAGQTILLRFRVVTNATTYPTYDPSYSSDPHGVFIDDVEIYGESYGQEIPEVFIWE